MIVWNVEGLFRGEWAVLFTYKQEWSARERMSHLQEANPQCRYRVRALGGAVLVEIKDGEA